MDTSPGTCTFSSSFTLKELKKRGAKTPLLTAVFAVYVLSPIYSNIVTTAIKDVFFAAAVIWYVVIAVSFYEDEKFLTEKKNVFKLCLSAILVFLLPHEPRSNLQVCTYEGFEFSTTLP